MCGYSTGQETRKRGKTHRNQYKLFWRTLSVSFSKGKKYGNEFRSTILYNEIREAAAAMKQTSLEEALKTCKSYIGI